MKLEKDKYRNVVSRMTFRFPYDEKLDRSEISVITIYIYINVYSIFNIYTCKHKIHSHQPSNSQVQFKEG